MTTVALKERDHVDQVQVRREPGLYWIRTAGGGGGAYMDIRDMADPLLAYVPHARQDANEWCGTWLRLLWVQSAPPILPPSAAVLTEKKPRRDISAEGVVRVGSRHAWFLWAGLMHWIGQGDCVDIVRLESEADIDWKPQPDNDVFE